MEFYSGHQWGSSCLSEYSSSEYQTEKNVEKSSRFFSIFILFHRQVLFFSLLHFLKIMLTFHSAFSFSPQNSQIPEIDHLNLFFYLFEVDAPTLIS